MFKLITAEDIRASSKATIGDEFNLLIDDIIIPRVCELLADECNRPDFDSKSRTELFSTRSRQRVLFLKSPPIAASPTIQVWQSTSTPRVFDAGTLLTKDVDYFVDEQIGIIERPSSSYFSEGPNVVKVVYTGGYVTSDGQGVPPLLKGAALYQAKLIFDRREELGVSSRSVEGGSLSLLPLILPPDIKKELRKFRLPTYC